jgi:hypothetical protein
LERSTKHGPALDDDLKHETEGLVRGGHSTRAAEWNDPEPSGEDQPDADRAVHAPERVVSLVKNLPSDREYSNLNEVWTALGGHVEERRS